MSTKNPLLVTFGQILRETREEFGVSQEQLALKATLHRNYIGILERGEQNPSLMVMLKIANALEIKLSDLLAKLPAEIVDAI